MNYLLDTNICVHYIRGNAYLSSIIKRIGAKNLYISEMTLGELYYGAECSARPVENHMIIDRFCSLVNVIPLSNVWREFAKQKAWLRSKGTMIEDADILIGCSAITYKMIMVTENTKHFERLQDMRIENWNIR